MATQASPNKTSNKQRIERIVKQARQKANSKTPKLFFEFLRHYYRNATLDDLDQFSDATLVAMAQRHYELARSRKRGENHVEVFQPEEGRDGWHQPRCVVMTATDDMPFLVDSLMLALRELNPSLEWMVHPVLRISRDKRGQMRELHKLSDSASGETESMVHMQSGPLSEKQRKKLQNDLQALMRDLRVVVADWPDMQTVTRQVIEELARAPSGCDMQQVSEAQAYIQWLSDHRFTFLGYCRRSVVGNNSGSRYVTDAGTGLGLLRDDLPKRDPEGYVASSTEVDKYAKSTRVLVISRGNTRSWIHHGEYMDVISVKRFAPDGSVCGLHRFIGLFANEAYASSPRLIPVVRQKLAHVTERADLRPQGHTAKNLNEILDSLPRDELFQASEDELYEMAMGILGLRDRQHLKLFVRQDRYRRFFACLVYMPRERFSHEVRERVAKLLAKELGGGKPEVSTEFMRRGMARLYCIVPTPESASVDKLDIPALEHKLIQATRSWQDHIVSAAYAKMDEAAATEAIMRFREHLPASYTATVEPEQAVEDLQALMALEEDGLSLRLSPAKDGMELRVYTRGFSITLSDLLPRLEHFGLQVRSQQPYESETEAGFYELQVLELDAVDIPSKEIDAACQRFEAAFLQNWYGQTESDGFNQLVLGAGLDWRQVVLLRSICKYLLQTGLPFGQRYMEGLLAAPKDIARDLFRLFESRFDPNFSTRAKDVVAARKRSETGLANSLRERLDAVSSLDADRAMRAFLGVILATERTNYYQQDEQGDESKPKPWVSLKIASARVHELPEPRPLYETFVYSPKVEGIHLRGGMVARGGLRWSDRQADFRTEVLGLMKAQMVKNTVIVPAGAKGGFVVKGGPPQSDREAWINNGIECYKTFLRGLLDITDNIKNDKIVPPKDVVRHDGDDPYLVVAADKGTATFSDIANSISEDYGHWLGDAFASGGSAGYDHKKMGITARGAWELVKRHFREIGVDIQREDFTVAGIGDMAGDVFGNGMLLSKHIRLVAAFNHMHIFLDPDPNPQSSYAERQRLFKLPRSSWADYDGRKISKGGGVFERSAKSIKLSDEVRQCLGIEAESLPPNELISAILKAPVDLLWNGGIGTYVKGSSESHSDVGDRANDNLRVNGRDLRCQVVGEGGNLGLTQAGRVEYALNGGRINTDAIDNSAGVDSSDREVNIKIPLNRLLLNDKLKRGPRDKLLSAMTDDVAAGVLQTNYQQGQAISMMARHAGTRLDEHANLMAALERMGLLNRSLEGLPDEEQLNERRNRGRGLSRPEIAVLLSYSKLSVFDDIVDSDLPGEDCLEADLLNYFPPALCKKYGDSLKSHRLRREIIANLLTNQIVNRMGAPFCHRLAEEHGVSRPQVVAAFYAATRIYGTEALWQEIDKLDNRIPADLQMQLHERVSGLLKHAVGWLLYNQSDSLGETIQRFEPGVTELAGKLKGCMSEAYREEWEETVKQLEQDKVPQALAVKVANTKVMGSALDVVRLSESSKQPVASVASTHFAVGELFSIPWLLHEILALRVEGRWQALARVTLRDDCYLLHRVLTARVLAAKGNTPQLRLDNWRTQFSEQVDFVLERLEELRSGEATDFMALTVAMRELRKLRLLKPNA